MKHGFTLVELSIVLVIIGLLIGGILVGQSLISAAEINRMVRNLQQYDIAIGSFGTKYKGLPGDSISFGGNGNRIIESGVGIFSSEVANAWPNLKISGFMPEKIFSNTLSGSFIIEGATVNSPSLKKGVGVMIMGYDTSSGSYTVPSVGLVNSFNAADWSTLTSSNNDITSAGDGALTPQEAYSIDQKLDDGKPAYGSVQNKFGMWSGGNKSNYCDTYNGSNNAAAATYKLTNTDKGCFISTGFMGQVLAASYFY